MFKKSTLSTLIDVPLSHIPKDVYDVSVNWIQERTIENLWQFVSVAADSILTDWAAQQGSDKGEKKSSSQHTSSSKSEVGTFVALAMILRSKPDALIILLPMLRVRTRYQGKDKLPFIVWMMAQASQGDLCAGLYSWAHNLLPLMGKKKKKTRRKKNSCSTDSVDLILQFVENILSNPKARDILVNGAVRKGQWLIPLASFEILLRLTFYELSARASARAIERFEAIYPLLKEVALAPDSATGSHRMKQIFFFSLTLAGEGISDRNTSVLANEATEIAIWCLTENADCFRQWDNLYTENLKASVAILKKLVDEWKHHSTKLSSSPSKTLILSQTIKSFRRKNEKDTIFVLYTKKLTTPAK